MARFKLEKQFRFEASHQLHKHDGKCSRLHGHSWVGTAIIEGDLLIQSGPKSGMLMDYGDVSAALKPIVENYLDHWHLNETLPGLEEPTSERIALWLYNILKPSLPLLVAIRIEETCTSAAEYRPNK